MATFKLLAPHALQMMTTAGRQSVLVEAGSIISTADLPAGFQPTVKMQPLDDEAESMIAVEADRLLSTGTCSEYGEIPSIGPAQLVERIGAVTTGDGNAVFTASGNIVRVEGR